MIRMLQVVVPARDEQQRLPRCLTAIRAAQAQAVAEHPSVRLGCTVVLDSCTDGSAAVARDFGVRSLSVEHGAVGATRHSGVLAALAEAASHGVPPEDTWIACTDADSVVPPHWLTVQLALARRYDAAVGTVEPWGLTDPAVLHRWQARHQLNEGHPHIHGANLGFRGSTYLGVGGFAPLSRDEDVDLVRRIRLHTTAWVATDRTRVASSARTVGRCRGGFADYLARLRVEAG